MVGGGDGGCFTNGRDMGLFWQALASGALVGPESLSLMLSVQSDRTGEDDRYGLGFWIDERDADLVFVQGFDPGASFLSYYRRGSGRSLTIAANVECRLGPVLRDWLPRLKGE